ncbi:hypothetical protein J2T09_001329 [Neorhizobium huautlense]|uniref:Transmembrane protein n=1 Tax=Neorhizobium huautlense TaxID=67774 RepID=A0ABT9PQT7_9HYPH|nr:hypothetical protein [Neorhizobium huautlense]MDP9836585.1 hypothetical protein [Neorhizobium huautlense]
MTPYLPFLCIAIGFSWTGFASVFTSRPNMSPPHLAQSTAANGIFLCALMLAFMGRGLFTGTILVVAGMALAVLLGHRISLPWSILIAAGGFVAYLYGAVG